METKVKDYIYKSADNLKIKVITKASANKVKIEKQSDESLLLKIYVTAVAEKGKANQAVINLLAKELKIAKSKITIYKGLNSTEKLIKLEGF